MSTRSYFAIVLATLASSLAPTAAAGFRIVEPPPVTVPKASSAEATPALASITPPRSGYVPLDASDLSTSPANRPTSRGFGLVAVTFVGTPPKDIEVRQGMGRDVRLADALRQIAPTGWRGFGRADIADTFDPNKRVSWKGGRPWVDVLDILANEQDLAVEVDWQRKHLYVGKREFRPAVGAGGAGAAATPAAGRPPFGAKAGSTLRATFDEWAKREGWTMVWSAQDLDYRIVAPLSFDGSIVDAVAKLTRLYETAERPLAVDIHTTQRVIVVSEKGGQ